ncbi:MAG: thioredoxin family protein [Planctomycetota bacterium]|nr:thioredoxin family protein [Planctomycetota bacterium]
MRNVAIVTGRPAGRLLLAGLVAALTAGAAAGGTNPLEGIREARQIAGPDFKLAQARGKVILLLYWGINGGDARTALSALTAVQTKYAGDRRVVVVASHVQTMSPQVREFLKTFHPTFPVFQGLEIPGSPAGEEVPTALLFTHTGAMTAQGDVRTLLKKLASLTEAAPEPLPDLTILDGVEVRHFRSEAAQLVPGKSIAPTIRLLDSRAKGSSDEAQEAAAIVKRARAWIFTETTRLADVSTTKPGAALGPLRILAATTAGLPEGDRPARLLADLDKEPGMDTLAQLSQTGTALLDRIYRDGEDVEIARQAAALRERLEACLEREDMSPALKREAQAMATAIADVGIGTAMWLSDYNEALRRAKTSHKPVLACFTGSDWCMWCMKLQNEVFETAEFKAWAAESVILLEVDFPRHKTLSPAAAKANDALQDKYVVRGFPTVLFLDADGAVMGKSGYVGGGAQRWIERARTTLRGG